MKRALAITILATAAIVAPVIGGGSAYAVFAARDSGNGATLAAAEQNARLSIIEDYGPCFAPYNYYAYGQLADGSWWADVAAECSYIH